MRKNCFSKQIFFLPPQPPPPPPPPTHHIPTHGYKKSEQGNGGYIGYIFPLSLSTIWANHLPFNFMLKFPSFFPKMLEIA